MSYIKCPVVALGQTSVSSKRFHQRYVPYKLLAWFDFNDCLTPKEVKIFSVAEIKAKISDTYKK